MSCPAVPSQSRRKEGRDTRADGRELVAPETEVAWEGNARNRRPGRSPGELRKFAFQAPGGEIPDGRPQPWGVGVSIGFLPVSSSLEVLRFLGESLGFSGQLRRRDRGRMTLAPWRGPRAPRRGREAVPVRERETSPPGSLTGCAEASCLQGPFRRHRQRLVARLQGLGF